MSTPQAAVIQPLGDVRGIGAVEMKPDVRILLLQGGSRCQKGVRGIAAQHDFPGNLPGIRRNVPLGLFHQGYDILGPFAQQDPLLGQRDLAFSPDEQLLPQLLFQLHELLGQGGLGDVQAFRRSCNILFSCNCQKIAQDANVHTDSPTIIFLLF